MKKVIVVIVSIIIISCFLMVGALSPKSQEISEVLLSQINPEEDDFLSYYEGDYKEILRLDSIHYGNYSSSDENEILAIIKILDAPHAAGLDRTIIAIFEAETGKIIMQKSFAGDDVAIHFLYSDITKTEDVFIISNTTYHGVTAYNMELYSLLGEHWLEKSLHYDTSLAENSDSILFFTDNKLVVFRLSMEMGNGQIGSDFTNLEFIETYFWDEYAGEFNQVH